MSDPSEMFRAAANGVTAEEIFMEELGPIMNEYDFPFVRFDGADWVTIDGYCKLEWLEAIVRAMKRMKGLA